MTLKTVPVTGTLFNPDGSKAAGVTLAAKLTVYDTDNGVVVPTTVTAASGSDGTYTIYLWPNSRGVNASQYFLTGQVPGALPGVLLFSAVITVPDSDPEVPVPVEVITNRTLPSAMSDSKAAMLAAQGFAVQAVQSAASAAQSAEDATIVSGIAGAVNAVAAIADQVSAVGAAAAQVVAVANDLVRVDAVANDLVNVDKVADDLINIDIVAGDKSNIDLVAAAKTNIDLVATNVVKVNAVANDIVRVVNVANDLVNIDAVANDLTNIDTLAANINPINQAVTASATAGVYPNSAASNVPRGLTQASVGAITPGAGGTNGTFSLSWSGGNFLTNPTGTFTVSGGVVTAVTITGPGLYIGASPTVPTPSFAASTGLTGAAVALTAQFLVTAGQGYWAASADGSTLNRYKNVGGVATADSSVPSIFSNDGTFGAAQEVVRKASPRVRNMLDSTQITDNSYVISTNGTLGSNVSFFVTDYIPVVPNSSLVSSHASYSAAGQGLAYYDAQKNYLSGSTTALVAGTPITIPSTARFIRISYRHSVVTDPTQLMILNSASLPAMFLPYGEFDWATNGFTAVDDSRARAAINRIDPDRITAGSALRFASGVVDASAGVFITNYIPVAPGGTLKTSPASTGVSGVYGMAWYDRNKNYISGVGGPFTDGQTYAAPNNAVYARFTVSNTQLGTFLVLPSTITPGHAYTHTPAKISDFKQWVGKSIMTLGDSISANYNWGAQLCSYLGATQSANNALGGRKMVDILKTPAGVPLTSADFTSVDAVEMLMGTNDYGNDTPLGTIADSTATATFYGYTKAAIEQMLTWKPTLRIVVSTLLQRSGGTTPNGVGKVLNDYAQALRDVAELYACPILDLNKISGVNALTIATYLSDGLHPPANLAGYTPIILNPAKGFFDRIWPTS